MNKELKKIIMGLFILMVIIVIYPNTQEYSNSKKQSDICIRNSTQGCVFNFCEKIKYMELKDAKYNYYTDTDKVFVTCIYENENYILEKEIEITGLIKESEYKAGDKK